MTTAGAADGSRGFKPHGPILLVAFLLLLVSAVVLPPLVNANRLRLRLAGSLSAALGRPVRMENVTLRLLPRPGFALENLEVAEDPAFGAEPLMRAASVTVGLRLLPLWRGRLEVATVALDQASLNVARNSNGQWNFETLLQRTSQLPAQLPTARHGTSAGARFPYFSVTNGRINLKRGTEKLPLSLTDAELSLWLETSTEWRLRFRAMPVRTDMDAAYTGEIRMAGSVQRLAGVRLHELPVNLEGSWRRAPLGEWTRMMHGQDSGWRGQTSVDFTLHGTASAADATAQLRVEGLRREDFVPVAPLDIDAKCTARVALLGNAMEQAECILPAETGLVVLSAQNATWHRNEAATAALVLQHVPAAWVLDAVRLVRRGIAPELQTAGEWNGSLVSTASDGAGRRLTGSVQWTGGALAWPRQAAPLALPEITLAADTASAAAMPAKATAPRRVKTNLHRTPAPLDPAALHLLPFEVAAGGTTPLHILGELTARSYTAELAGGVDLATAAPLLRSLGFARLAVLRSASGEADVALQVEDRWMQSPDMAVKVLGTVALRNVTADTAWLPATLHLARADVTLSDDAVLWKGLQWTWAGSKFDGSASKARLCEGSEECAWHLIAHTPMLNLAQVESAFTASGGDGLAGLFRVGGNPVPGGWPLFKIDLTADTLSLAQPEGAALDVAHASASLTAAGSTVTIGQCSGVALNGTLECAGTVSLSQRLADLTVGATRVNFAAAGNLFHEKWGHGVVEAQLHLLDRQSNVTGEFTARMQDAGLGSAVLAGTTSLAATTSGTTILATPLSHIDSWQMSGTLADGRLILERSLLSSGATDVSVTGSVGLDRTLDLTMKPQGTGAAQHVSGTVQAPSITSR